MAKNRTIPFGYCMKNGEITTEPKEVYAVVTIFDEYLKGRSLSEIAKLMQSEKIRYNADSDKWNKNMVKRIIENEKYLGTDKYPQIIDDDTFRLANEKRIRKATTLDLIPDDLQEIRKCTYCTECGHKLSRNSAIANPSLLELGGEISTYSPTADIVRKQNEINHMTDSAQADFDRVKAEIFKLAEMKYDCCTYNDSPQKTDKIKELLKNHEQLNSLDIGLFKACVSRIWISHFCTIEVEFINGVKIKNTTERMNENEYSAECNDNSCKNPDCGKP